MSKEKSKLPQPIMDQGGHLVFRIGPKNTNLVKDVNIFLPVKFRRILFSGFREEVENVSANQRPGKPSCFSDQPEKHKLGRGLCDLASCQVSLNSVQWFQRSRKCLSQSEARAANFFPIAEKTNLVEVLPFKFRWIPFCSFREEVENVPVNQTLGLPSFFRPARKTWIPFSGFREEVENVKVNDGQRTDDRRTDDGQRVITIVHLSLRLSCT